MRKVLAFFAETVGVDEIQIIVALAMIAAGCWQVWRPGAFLIPGFVLLWMALPPRKPFVANEAAPEIAKRRPH